MILGSIPVSNKTHPSRCSIRKHCKGRGTQLRPKKIHQSPGNRLPKRCSLCCSALPHCRTRTDAIGELWLGGGGGAALWVVDIIKFAILLATLFDFREVARAMVFSLRFEPFELCQKPGAVAHSPNARSLLRRKSGFGSSPPAFRWQNLVRTRAVGSQDRVRMHPAKFSRFAAGLRYQTTVSSRGFLVVLQDRHRVNGWNVPSLAKSAINNPPNDHCIKSSRLTLPDHSIPDMNDHQFISHG